jgi:integrase
MAILAQCPICRTKQKLSNKKCKCGEDLDKAKRSNRVKFYIRWRKPNGVQKQEYTGTSIKDAQASEGKRLAQKKENPRVLEIQPDHKTTFAALAKWYTDRPKRKKIKTSARVKLYLDKFNEVFGNWPISDFHLSDLQDYIEQRKDEGLALSTVDMEKNIVKQMVQAAFDDDKISGHALKVFKRFDRTDSFFTQGDNARERTIFFNEYKRLLDVAQSHLKGILIVAMNTGMRIESEVLGLKWSRVKRKDGFIRLTAKDTKEGKPKKIPINHNVAAVLDSIVPHVHHPYVFTCHHKPMKKLSHFKLCCERAGLPYGYKTENGIVARDIRRTVKTNMVEAGIDEIYRDILLGHSKKGMDKHYIQVKEETLTKVMEQYTAWLDSQLANVDHTVDQKT